MVIAHHLVWTAYGWWLPNDPRGSTSRRIASDVIAELGKLHYGRKRVQPAGWEIREFHDRASNILKYPLLTCSHADRDVIARGFAEVVRLRKYTCYACAVMPDHVHILIRKHRDKAEQMIENLQDASREHLREEGLRDEAHPVWGGPGPKVFQDHPDGIRRTIKYIRANPSGRKLSPQSWPFVKEYDGWPLHPGHNPNSPYARRASGQPF